MNNFPKNLISLILILSVSIFFISSCKKAKKEEKKYELTARDLTGGEVEIAKDICESLKAKRLYFKRLSLGDKEGQFKFQNYFQDCGQVLLNQGKLIANFNPSSYRYDTRSRYSRFMPEVIDDDRGPMKDFCHEIIDRNNTTSLSNTIDSGDEKLIYRFINSKNSIFEVDTYILENDRWKKIFIDSYEVIKSSDVKNGMVRQRIRAAQCLSGETKITKQLLL